MYIAPSVICHQDQSDIHKLATFHNWFVPDSPVPNTFSSYHLRRTLSTPSFAWSSIFSKSSTIAEGSKKSRVSIPPSSLEEDNEYSLKWRRLVIRTVGSKSDVEPGKRIGISPTPKAHEVYCVHWILRTDICCPVQRPVEGTCFYLIVTIILTSVSSLMRSCLCLHKSYWNYGIEPKRIRQ